MIAHRKEFFGGAGLLAGFFIVLVIIFMPVFNGQNGLDYLDGLYNSISKGSAYYIPQVAGSVADFNGTHVELELGLSGEEHAERTAVLFRSSGATVNVSAATLAVSGDLGRMLSHCLTDADNMYANNGRALTDKYGYGGKRALYNWWTALKSMEKELKAQKKFKAAKVVATVGKKAVETAYNYYTIEPQKITAKLGVVIFSLVFYVVYTLWYGFAILFLFEGWGLKLEH